MSQLLALTKNKINIPEIAQKTGNFLYTIFSRSSKEKESLWNKLKEKIEPYIDNWNELASQIKEHGKEKLVATYFNIYQWFFGKEYKEVTKIEEEYTSNGEKKNYLIELLYTSKLSKKVKGYFAAKALKDKIKLSGKILERAINLRTVKKIEKIIDLYKELLNLKEYSNFKEIYAKLEQDGKINYSYSTFMRYIKELRDLNIIIDKRHIKMKKFKESSIFKLNPYLILNFMDEISKTDLSFNEKEKIKVNKCEEETLKEMLMYKYLLKKYSMKELVSKYAKEEGNENEIKLFIPLCLYKILMYIGPNLGTYENSLEWGFKGIGTRKKDTFHVEGIILDEGGSRVYTKFFVPFIISLHTHLLNSLPSKDDWNAWLLDYLAQAGFYRNNPLFIVFAKENEENKISLSSYDTTLNGKKLKIYTYGGSLRNLDEIKNKIKENNLIGFIVDSFGDPVIIENFSNLFYLNYLVNNLPNIDI